MFRKFRKKQTVEYTDRVEERFQTIVNLIKDLDKREFNRLQEGIALAWESYNKVRQTRSAEEKEVDELDNIEKSLSE